MMSYFERITMLTQMHSYSLFMTVSFIIEMFYQIVLTVLIFLARSRGLVVKAED